MNIASVTSPFVNSEETPWIIWKSQERVSSLPAQKQSNDSPTSHARFDEQELPPLPPAPPINRMQYNTVMNRIVQASKKTGNYSSWTP